jgi:beta-glucosidase/6-phospho-beta-glucosidase/beta-galactosidase
MGIATDNEEHRRIFFERSLFALSQAVKEGHLVTGCCVRSLLDDYDWGSYEKHYGLFAYDRTNNTRAQTIKPGAIYLVDIIKQYQPGQTA